MYSSLKYVTTVTLDGLVSSTCIIGTKDSRPITIPINSANADYAEIMRQVEAGTLTIADAD